MQGMRAEGMSLTLRPLHAGEREYGRQMASLDKVQGEILLSRLIKACHLASVAE